MDTMTKTMIEEMRALIDRAKLRHDELQNQLGKVDTFVSGHDASENLEHDLEFTLWAIGANLTLMSSVLLRYEIAREDIETLPF